MSRKPPAILVVERIHKTMRHLGTFEPDEVIADVSRDRITALYNELPHYIGLLKRLDPCAARGKRQ